MKLHDLLQDCFTPKECRIFLADALGDTGRDVWDSTTDGPWKTRAFEVSEVLDQRGLAKRPLFEALVKELPNRADDVSAACRWTTDEPLSYAAGTAPPEEQFPWEDYREAMSPGLVRVLRYAAYDARSRGHATISTTEVFRVYRALQPWLASAFETAKGLKPAPLENEEDVFDGKLGASFCVSKTIHGLAAKTTQPTRFDEHDVFLDLARFGNGKSARKFAPDGAALEAVNAMSRDLAIGRRTRHGSLD